MDMGAVRALWGARRALFCSGIIGGLDAVFAIIGLSTSWFIQSATSTITVTQPAAGGGMTTATFTLVNTRTSTLVLVNECHPAFNFLGLNEPAGCLSTSLASHVPGDTVDLALYRAGVCVCLCVCVCAAECVCACVRACVCVWKITLVPRCCC